MKVFIQYFSEGNLPLFDPFALRAKQFDDKNTSILPNVVGASVINLDAGLDTTIYRIVTD